MSDGVLADPAGLREVAGRVRHDASTLNVCAAVPPTSLAGDGAGLGSVISAFAQAEAQATQHLAQGFQQLAERLEERAVAAEQADRFGAR